MLSPLELGMPAWSVRNGTGLIDATGAEIAFLSVASSLSMVADTEQSKLMVRALPGIDLEKQPFYRFEDDRRNRAGRLTRVGPTCGSAEIWRGEIGEAATSNHVISDRGWRIRHIDGTDELRMTRTSTGWAKDIHAIERMAEVELHAAGCAALRLVIRLQDQMHSD